MKRLPATSVYYGVELLLSMPSFVFVAVYLVREVGLDPLQLVLVGTVMEAAIFVFEIPTGVVADVYSRRASIVVSLVLQGIATVLVGAIPHFVPILLAWAFWGFGYTFMSGAYEAWLTDEVGVERVGPVLLRGRRLGYAGGLLGLGLGTAAATADLRLPVVAGGALTILAGLACAFAMPETGFRRQTAARQLRRSLLEARSTAGAASRLVRARPLLLVILAIDLFAGMSSETFDRLWEAHFIRDVGLPGLGSLDPVVWFGLLSATTLAVGLVASTILIRRFERLAGSGLVGTLLAMTLVLAGGQIAFGLAGGFAVAVGALLLTRLMRSLAYPLSMTWLNQQITDSSVRATVISIVGQADAVGQAGGGPALGLVGNVFGIRAALVAGGLVLSPAAGLYARALRRGGDVPAPEELAVAVEA